MNFKLMHKARMIRPDQIRAILAKTRWTQAQLAAELETTQPTVSRWLSSSRPSVPEPEIEQRITSLLISLGLTEAVPTLNYVVPIIGEIGLGEEVLIMEGASDQVLDHISLPFGLSQPNCKALVAKGNSQWPRVKQGDVVVYSRNDTSPEDMIGEEAIVKLVDGRILLKTIRRGHAPGVFTLESHNAGPIEDVEVEWVGNIEVIVPRGRWRSVVPVSA
jgi:transcriptional regulator with XRE-family HTH domain